MRDVQSYLGWRTVNVGLAVARTKKLGSILSTASFETFSMLYTNAFVGGVQPTVNSSLQMGE
jgi:hypothetical protein